MSWVKPLDDAERRCNARIDSHDKRYSENFGRVWDAIGPIKKDIVDLRIWKAQVIGIVIGASVVGQVIQWAIGMALK